jgi:hypothetical protein
MIRQDVVPTDHGETIWAAQVGRAKVELFHNGYHWVMRFAEGGRHNRLLLGQNAGQMWRLSGAFWLALRHFHSQSPMVMVGGVPFNVAEARAMFTLLNAVLRR